MARSDRYTCEAALKRLDDFLDRELTAAEMERVREHLEACAHCADTFAAEADLLQAIRTKLKRIAVPPELLARCLSSCAFVWTEPNGK
jgi:anti-sigma factor (TIGR02949 family)